MARIKIYKLGEDFASMPEKMPHQTAHRFAEGAKDTYAHCQKEWTWEDMGLRDFKRRVLGICGRKTVKSVDELAEILTEMKIVVSPTDGKQFIQELYGKEVEYDNGILEFRKVYNREGQIFCEIRRRGLPTYG